MAKINYLDPNPGGDPVILLVHGLGATGASWSLQFHALADGGYRPIALDLPGFGSSQYDGQGWNINRMAGDLAGILDELACDRAHVIGLSLGGIIAQQFAHSYPERLRCLVLVSTFAKLHPDNFSGWFYFLRRVLVVSIFGLRTQAIVVARRVFPAEEQKLLREALIETISKADPRAYRSAMVSLGTFNSSRWLDQIQAPTLVVTGSVDTTVSPRRQKLLAGHIPGAQQVIIDGANHAVPVDKAEEFNRILLDFFSQV